jgi:hypothetical protein
MILLLGSGTELSRNVIWMILEHILFYFDLLLLGKLCFSAWPEFQIVRRKFKHYSDSQQFYQYQEEEQSPLVKHKKKRPRHDIRNSGSGFGQAQKCGSTYMNKKSADLLPFNKAELHCWCNRCGFDYEIGICCFSAKHPSLRRKDKDWLARNLDNFLSAATCLSANCCFSELALNIQLRVLV